jgi:hypothetical protein
LGSDLPYNPGWGRSQEVYDEDSMMLTGLADENAIALCLPSCPSMGQMILSRRAAWIETVRAFHTIKTVT